MISLIINADTRSGYLQSIRGEGWGKVSLQGARSVDFLTEGIRQKIKFLSGHEIQCVLYIDKHEEISKELMEEMESIVYPCGNNSKIIVTTHNRNVFKWNDKIYIDALKYAEGNYVCHIDQDANCFKENGSKIIDNYLQWLNEYKYICQPWNGIGDKMNHASTRFFICKRETLDFNKIENSLSNPLNGFQNPCLEFTLAILSDFKVLYPERNDNDYIIFNWANYCAGTLKKLNGMPYHEVIKHISNLGIHGPNDVVDKN